MENSVSLSAYVKRVNGVGLGAPGSLKNMLEKSLGANSFYLFWKYWNPIWGYYLSKKIMKPCRKLFPIGLAVVITFSISGALHDLAVTLIKMKVTFFFTPWFFFMGLLVIGTNKLQISYEGYPWLLRAFINISFIAICFLITTKLQNYYA